MRVAVLGGTQFIGRATTARLLNAGCEVTLINRGKTENPFAGSVRHIVCDRRSSGLAGSFVYAADAFVLASISGRSKCFMSAILPHASPTPRRPTRVVAMADVVEVVDDMTRTLR